MAKLMEEAIDKEDFERIDRGQSPRPRVKVKMPIPDPPVVENQVRYEEIQVDLVKGVEAGRSSVRNKEGALFMGFNVQVALSGKKPVNGWMSEEDFLKLRRAAGDKIDLSKITF